MDTNLLGGEAVGDDTALHVLRHDEVERARLPESIVVVVGVLLEDLADVDAVERGDEAAADSDHLADADEVTADRAEVAMDDVVVPCIERLGPVEQFQRQGVGAVAAHVESPEGGRGAAAQQAGELRDGRHEAARLRERIVEVANARGHVVLEVPLRDEGLVPARERVDVDVDPALVEIGDLVDDERLGDEREHRDDEGDPERTTFDHQSLLLARHGVTLDVSTGPSTRTCPDRR